MVKTHIVMPTSSMDGYGYSGEELVLAASRLGADITYTSHDWKEPTYTDDSLLKIEIDRDEAFRYTELGYYVLRDIERLLLVYFIPYAFHQFRAGFQIGQTMFETSEIPDVWAAFCTIPDALIVPSEFCKEVFHKKVDTPIITVPLGVNTSTYRYVSRDPSETFTFLMAGLLHYRKGAEFAVRAFKEEFHQKEPVRLVLKTRKGFLDVGEESLDDERIEVVNWNYSRSEMLDLYHAADCFIACSRGEASGLTPREAMSTGIPAIVTDWGGLREIADSRYTYPLQIDGEEEAPVVCSSYSEGITQGQPIGNFAVPSVDHLKSLMREIYEDRKSAANKGTLASQWIEEEWNYDKCAKKWLQAIQDLYETRKH